MDYKEVLSKTRWFQIIDKENYQHLDLKLMNYVLTEYYSNLSSYMPTFSARMVRERLEEERSMVFSLIDSMIFNMFHEILRMAEKEFVFKLKDYHTSLLELLLDSKIHNDYVRYKNLNNSNYCLLSDAKRIIDGKEYDDRNIRKFVFRHYEVECRPFIFDLDKLKSLVLSYKRSEGYMERRYNAISSIIRYGLCDEETFSFVGENLTKKFRKLCFTLSRDTSSNAERLIAKKKRDPSSSDYTIKELNTKLFFSNMITYHTLKDLSYWDQSRYFQFSMRVSDIPHITPIASQFTNSAREVFFSQCDRIIRVEKNHRKA